MRSKPIDEILTSKPVTRQRVNVYAIDDAAHAGLLKIGQTTRDVKQSVAEQVKTPAIKNYRIEIDESAEREDGTLFSDHEVRAFLVKKGFENAEIEWMRCSVAEVLTALPKLRTGRKFLTRISEKDRVIFDRNVSRGVHRPSGILVAVCQRNLYYQANNTCQASQRCSNRRVFSFFGQRSFPATSENGMEFIKWLLDRE